MSLVRLPLGTIYIDIQYQYISVQYISVNIIHSLINGLVGKLLWRWLCHRSATPDRHPSAALRNHGNFCPRCYWRSACEVSNWTRINFRRIFVGAPLPQRIRMHRWVPRCSWSVGSSPCLKVYHSANPQAIGRPGHLCGVLVHQHLLRSWTGSCMKVWGFRPQSQHVATLHVLNAYQCILMRIRYRNPTWMLTSSFVQERIPQRLDSDTLSFHR